MSWTIERVEILKRGWAEGQSAAQIASELGDGVTRSSVLGKVHRLHLSSRMTVTWKARDNRIVSARTPKKRIAIEHEPELRVFDLPPEPPSLEHKVHCMEAGYGQCRFPLWGDDAAFADKFYCGTPGLTDGAVYCSFHNRIAYSPRPARKPQVYWPDRMRKAG